MKRKRDDSYSLGEDAFYEIQELLTNDPHTYAYAHGDLKFPSTTKERLDIIRKLCQQLDPNPLQDQILIKVLGHGCCGVVFQIEHEIALKIAAIPTDKTQEVDIQSYLAQHDITVPIYKHIKTKNKFGQLFLCMYMEQVDGTLESLLKKDRLNVKSVATQLVKILQRLKELAVYHGDIHLNNIAYKTIYKRRRRKVGARKTPQQHLKVLLIDFGNAKQNATVHHNMYDHLLLLSQLHPKWVSNRKIDQKRAARNHILFQKLLTIYNKWYPQDKLDGALNSIIKFRKELFVKLTL